MRLCMKFEIFLQIKLINPTYQKKKKKKTNKKQNKTSPIQRPSSVVNPSQSQFEKYHHELQ